ncbi:MAG TPA: zinc ribbon domain-containing protein [Solirubrobacteraceae bacterium]|nr:zinc ribbon domain-containing protein [Solirubrobacteraceae bacterium]
MRCGAPLGDQPEAAGPSRRRGQFAAAPNEPLNLPALVSSLFPHLPRRSMAAFRIVLAAGLIVVLVLGALRLFPVALIAGAVLLPLVTLLYLWDTDIYEDEPMQVVILTMVWGAIAGVITGVIGQGLSGSVATLSPDEGSIVLDQGIIVPLIGMVLTLLGPLALLRYRRFNDVLDGVTFGAGAGAAFAAGEVITYSFSILSGGLRPSGSVLPMLGRLGTIALTIPVLEMAVIGAVGGGLWLQFRAPVRDREALGVLGNPLAALLAAAVLIAVGFSLEPLMDTGLWLLCLAVLDVIALLWLRRVIHLGLLEEAAEIPIGPSITCANCGEPTPRHTFCINCGISLQALPKARPGRPVSGPASSPPSGPAPSGPSPSGPPPSPPAPQGGAT